MLAKIVEEVIFMLPTGSDRFSEMRKLACPPARTDSELADAIREALEWDEFVPHESVRATVCEGLVTLEGTVRRFHESAYAERIIRLLAGVRGVRNRLAVREAEEIPTSREPKAG